MNSEERDLIIGGLCDLMRQLEQMKESVTIARLQRLQNQISELEGKLSKLSRKRGDN
jgi:TolA-binding protein